MQSEISLSRKVKKFLPVTIAAVTIGCAGLDTGEMLKTTVQGITGTGPYANQNIVATYSVTKQHVHIATRKLGKGMVAAVTALGIKNEVDVPQLSPTPRLQTEVMRSQLKRKKKTQRS
jgi:hypothetical protein